MENTISFGIQFSVFIISLLATFKIISNSLFKQNVNIVLVYLDKDNKYITKSTIKENLINEEINLDAGYKLNHYEWDENNNILFLFIKPHDYTESYDGRYRQIVLSHILYPIKIKETYHKEVF